MNKSVQNMSTSIDKSLIVTNQVSQLAATYHLEGKLHTLFKEYAFLEKDGADDISCFHMRLSDFLEFANS